MAVRRGSAAEATTGREAPRRTTGIPKVSIMNKLIPTVLLAAAAALVACGGGSGMSSPTTATGNTPVMTTGTITGFGSIYVNGVHFQTTSATIRKNGQVVAQSALKVGEVAHIKGSENDSDGTGNADSVDVEQNVVGPIDKIDKTSTPNTITVLGQTVKIDNGTSFSPDVKDISGLNPKDFVEVSGLIAADGSISATRIERDTSAGTLQVLGKVSKLTTNTFMINALTVNYSTANLTGFASGPANDDLVEVQGTMFDPNSVTLTATRVDKQMSDEEQAGDHRDMELEGLINSFTSPTDFKVGDQKVTTTGTTVYRNGTVADLANDVKVEVEGSLNPSNVLVADVVSFHHNGGIELQSTVEAVDPVAGTLKVLGVEITVTSSTRFEDRSSAQVEMFSLSNIKQGDTVDVRGFENPAAKGTLIATRLEREPASTEVEVGGPFAAGTSPSQFTVFGITVDASTATTLRDASGATLTLDAFLTQAVGQNVEVTGQLSGMSMIVTASEARIHAPGND
jgi:hypothetical protein